MPETIEAEHTEVKEPSLLDILKRSTEHKAESATNKDAWSFSAVEPDSTAPASTQTTEEKSADKPADKSGKPKVTDEEKRISAQTATAMVDSGLSMIGYPVINSKFKKKFTPDELNKALDLEDLDKEKLQGEDLALRNKFDKWAKKRDKSLAEVSLKPAEEKRLETAFYQYFKMKDIALPPEWLLYMNLADIVGGRVIDFAFD